MAALLEALEFPASTPVRAAQWRLHEDNPARYTGAVGLLDLLEGHRTWTPWRSKGVLIADSGGGLVERSWLANRLLTR